MGLAAFPRFSLCLLYHPPCPPMCWLTAYFCCCHAPGVSLHIICRGACPSWASLLRQCPLTHPFAAAAAFAPVASSRTRAAVSITGLAAAAAAAACRCRLAKLSVCMWESVCGPAAARGTSSNGSGGRGMCRSCSFCYQQRHLHWQQRRYNGSCSGT